MSAGNQRIYHWANTVAVITLTTSGWMIYQPRKLPSLEGTPSNWFFWHRWGVALLLVSLIFHVIYESFIVRRYNPIVVNRAELKKFHLSSITFSVFPNPILLLVNIIQARYSSIGLLPEISFSSS